MKGDQRARTASRCAAISGIFRDGHPIALYFSLHNTETGEYLEGPPEQDGDGRFRPLAERFFRILSAETSFAPATPLHYADTTTTAGSDGRMTVVLGPYHDFTIPAFLMEQRIFVQPEAGPPARSPRPALVRAELVEAIGKAIYSKE